MFTYIPNLKSQSATFEPTPPWQKTSPGGGIPIGLSKDDFTKWSAHPKTDHVFFSMTEGLTPSMRVGATNPPRRVYGIVGDYDSDRLIQSTDAEVIELIKDVVAKKGVHPNHMSRTFSNKIRLVWIFEKAVPGDPDEMLTEFYDMFASRAGIRAMLPGFDSTSLSANHFFEQGHSWHDFGRPPISANLVGSCWFRAGGKTHLKVDTEVRVPLEVVMEEIERVYPGRVTSPLSIGRKLPVFWIDDGRQTEGVEVRENGVVCYSDRVPEGFRTWKQIFGGNFVKDYEEKILGSILDRFAYDGNRYWALSSKGRWQDHPRENINLRLKKAHFSEKVSKGQDISPLEDAVLNIQELRRVDEVAPLLYNPHHIVDHEGTTFLNISRAKALPPLGTGESDPGKCWPLIHEYLTEFLDPDPYLKTDPLMHLLSWMKYFWESALRGSPEAGQMIIVAGGRDAGKTLFGKHILGPMMGGSADATKYVLGISEFNKELPFRGVWRIDDSAPPDSEAGHSKYSDKMKSLVANMECPFRAMYRDNVTVPWHGRIYLTCNLNAEARGILPKLSDTMLDKVMLFKAKDREPGFFPPRLELESQIAAELPFFLEWLHNDFVIPDEVRSPSKRFGITPYHHGSIVDIVRQQSPEQNLADLIDIWVESYRELNKDESTWEGNPTQLMHELEKLGHSRMSMPANVKQLSIMLGKLHENHHWRILKHKTKARANKYVIDLRLSEPPRGG